MNGKLEHFVTLAQRGNYPAASGGEGRAHKLASVIVECVPGLDSDAIGGLLEFALLTHSRIETAEALLAGRVTFVSENRDTPDYIIPVVMDSDELSKHVFDHVWHALEQLAVVDSVGACQYRRVLSEWIAGGRPDDMGTFILDHTHDDPMPRSLNNEST